MGLRDRVALTPDTIKFMILLIGGGSVLWSQLSSVPKVTEKVDGHEHRLTIMEAKIDGIKEDLGEIKHMLRRRTP